MKKIKVILFTCVLYFFVYTIQLVILHAFVNPLITPLMVKRVAEGLFEEGSARGIHKSWVSMKHISPNMVKAVMASEDQKFLEHNGFDWDAIKKAMDYNKRKKGKKILIKRRLE
ncbi:MAG: transglycosylase domain-containing protein [Cytophagales bacterium]|nr:transglycosylase domain-containing protein [Cytophaga sp.]